MAITITNVTNKAAVHNIFEELYESSVPHMSSETNPYAIKPIAAGLTAKEQFKSIIFKDIDKEKQVAGTILVKIDKHPLSLLSYIIGEDRLMRVTYALYNNYENSRSWIYGDLMKEHLLEEMKYFHGLGCKGYSFTVNINAPTYLYHKEDRPDLDKYFTITEEVTDDIVTVTLRFKQENPFN